MPHTSITTSARHLHVAPLLGSDVHQGRPEKGGNSRSWRNERRDGRWSTGGSILERWLLQWRWCWGLQYRVAVRLHQNEGCYGAKQQWFVLCGLKTFNCCATCSNSVYASHASGQSAGWPQQGLPTPVPARTQARAPQAHLHLYTGEERALALSHVEGILWAAPNTPTIGGWPE